MSESWQVLEVYGPAEVDFWIKRPFTSSHLGPFSFVPLDRQRKTVQFKLDPPLLDINSVLIIVLVEVLTDLDIADIIVDDHAEIIF